MRHFYLLFFLTSSMLLRAQTAGAQPVSYQAVQETAARTHSNSYAFCDTNQDGLVPIDLQNIRQEALAQYGGDLGSEQGIYISTRLARVHLISNINDNPQKTQVCNGTATVGGFGMLDIAMDQDGDMFVSAIDKVYQINSSCGAQQTLDFGLNGSSITALSFDRNRNLYLGGFDTSVYRLLNGDYQNMLLWHNFNDGAAAGDFVMCGDKMYVAWRINNHCRLYEVTVNATNDYMSHVDLGALPDQTFGLASELGVLYGVTPQQLYKIDRANMTFNVLLQNNNPNDDWYGAAGRNEAVPFEVAVYATPQDAQNSSNVLPSIWTNTTAFEQAVYVVIRNTVTGQSTTVPVQLHIAVAPANKAAAVWSHCQSDTNAATFDLNVLAAAVKGNQDASVAFFASQTDADSSNNALGSTLQINANSQQLYVRMVNRISGCVGLSTVLLSITPKPVFHKPQDLKICSFNAALEVDMTRQVAQILGDQEAENLEVTFHASSASAQDGTTVWAAPYHFNIGTTTVYVRLYDVSSGCLETGSFQVIVAQEFTDVTLHYQVQTSDWTTNANSISIVSNGHYEYSLNGSAYQDSPIFEGLNAGAHQLQVRDKAQCGKMTEEVFLLMFPKYFTPNGDGFNDQWNIILGANEPNMEVVVYDRYGKLVAHFDGRGAGWDGKVLGRELPASDYWFTVIRGNGKEFKGHFTLKR